MDDTKKKKIRMLAFIVVFVVLIGFGGYYLYGQRQIDRLQAMTFEDMLAYTTENRSEAVITVGILRDDEMVYAVYGENGEALPPQEHIYEIGSITKTFTASLLCKAIGEGRLRLDDSIDAHLNLRGQPTYPTIGALATHTSGYKEHYFETPMISNFLQGGNPFAGISKEMLRKRTGKIDPNRAAFTYSNFGFAVLGAVLEKVYDKDYAPLIDGYISQDLGLANTRISDGLGDLNGYWRWLESDAYRPAARCCPILPT